MTFELPELPYSYESLETLGMSKETLEFHHDLHHKAYVDNGNKLLEGAGYDGKSLEEIVKDTYDPNSLVQSGLFNNASQHWNHIQFWQMMGPAGKTMPSSLQTALIDQFGSIESFIEQFINAGIGQFGSGWCWLVKESNGDLKITKTENGVNPLCFDQIALLGCDVWEHSYYIDFRNKRPAYLQNFLENLVNWEEVANRMG